MKHCNNCGQSYPDADATVCNDCGTALETISDPATADSGDDQDLDFVVTEAAESEPEFVGGAKKFVTDDPDRMGSESTPDATINDSSMTEETDLALISGLEDDEDGLIGQSAPILPEPLEVEQSLPGPSDNDGSIHDSAESSNDSSAPFNRLSEDEVTSIGKDLYRSDNYISDEEKSNLLDKIGRLSNRKTEKPDKPSSPSPSRPKQEESRHSVMGEPKMAGMTHGVAFFYRNYLHVPAVHEFYDGEEMTIGERQYLLRHKKFNTKLVVGAASLIFAAILFFIGSLFISNTGARPGHVVGVVYNLDGTTNVAGASVRFPNLNRIVESDPEGFFRSGSLPSGPHQVEYIIDGEVVMTDYVTVTEGHVSTINLSPRQPAPQKVAAKKPSRPRPQTKLQVVSERRIDQETTPPKKQSPKSAARNKNTQKKTASSKPARIKLAANTDGARLSLDGKILGAGNLTYSRISAGKHSYVVSKDGYHDKTGSINLDPGKTRTLTVTLTPMETVEKEDVFDHEDYYYSGVTALNEKDFVRAVTDLNRAIELQPSYTDAYLARARVYSKLNKKKQAHDNYVRAAEILVFRKDYNKAITAYNKALEMNSKSVPALIGRGQTYLTKGQEIAAVADFQSAKKLDKRNFAAYFGIGEARFRQGNYKKAVEGFKRARKLNDKDPLVHQYLMLSYLARDDFKNVKKSFDKFKDVATDEQYNRFLADRKSEAVMQVVENR